MLRVLQRSAGVAALLCGALVAQAQLISRPVPAADAVDRGQKQFVIQCAGCHGADARGDDSGPDLVRSEIVLDDEQGSLLGPVIRKGSPNAGMPSFNLPEAQIRDLAAFLRERTQVAINRNAYPLKDLLTGDAKAGQAFFNGAGRCGTCHSPTGDLAGLATRFQPAQLQTRFLYPRGGRGGPNGQTAKPTTATVTPRAGKPVSGTLEFIDDFTVGVRDADGYYRSFTRDSVKVDVQDPLAAHAQLLKQYTDKNFHDVLAYLVTLK